MNDLFISVIFILAVIAMIVLIQFTMRYKCKIVDDAIDIRSRLLFFIPIHIIDIKLDEIEEIRYFVSSRLIKSFITTSYQLWHLVYYSRLKRSGIEIVLKKETWLHPKYIFVTPNNRDEFIDEIKAKKPDIQIIK